MSWIIVGSAGVNCMPVSKWLMPMSDINKRVDYIVIMMRQFSLYIYSSSSNSNKSATI